MNNIIGKENNENILNGLDSVTSSYMSTAQKFSEIADDGRVKIEEKLKDIPTFIKNSSTTIGEITDDQMEAINKKLEELQGSEYTQDLKVFQEIDQKETIVSPKEESSNIKIVQTTPSDEVVKETKVTQDIQGLSTVPKPKLIGNKPLAKDKAKSTVSFFFWLCYFIINFFFIEKYIYIIENEILKKFLFNFYIPHFPYFFSLNIFILILFLFSNNLTNL